MTSTSSLAALEQWYRSVCDGEWEHQYGITLTTLDNPGWHLTIELTETPLANRTFREVSDLEPPVEWVHCRVVDNRFDAAGGPGQLDRMIQIFVAWASDGAPA